LYFARTAKESFAQDGQSTLYGKNWPDLLGQQCLGVIFQRCLDGSENVLK
jgi:hypothetical protein